MIPLISKQEQIPLREWNGKLPTLSTSGISTACYASAINSMKCSALPKKSKPRWAWTLNSNCGDGQMLAPARCPVPPRDTPTLMIDDGGVRQPAASQVHHKTLFRWIVGNLSWLEQYDTVYIFVDNRALSGASPPDYWQFFAPWIKSRCEVIGPYQEKTTAVYIPINADTGLDQVHYTWAGAAVLEALCLVYLQSTLYSLTRTACPPPSSK